MDDVCVTGYVHSFGAFDFALFVNAGRVSSSFMFFVPFFHVPCRCDIGKTVHYC